MGMKKCCDNCSGFKCLLTALEDALVAGKGLGEDVTNGAAARPVVAAGEGRAREERVREKGKV
jgi:hypothetical protein